MEITEHLYREIKKVGVFLVWFIFGRGQCNQTRVFLTRLGYSKERSRYGEKGYQGSRSCIIPAECVAGIAPKSITDSLATDKAANNATPSQRRTNDCSETASRISFHRNRKMSNHSRGELNPASHQTLVPLVFFPFFLFDAGTIDMNLFRSSSVSRLKLNNTKSLTHYQYDNIPTPREQT